MIGNLLRVSADELESYLNDSSALEERLYSDLEKQDDKLTDIDKTWHGIIFLLTGESYETDHPMLRVIFSGQLIDEGQDLGYGPAHYLTPAQVAEINTQISGITSADLKQKFDAQKMTELEIYPTVWNEEGDEAFDYLAEGFATLQKVYAEAAKNGEGLIVFIN